MYRFTTHPLMSNGRVGGVAFGYYPDMVSTSFATEPVLADGVYVGGGVIVVIAIVLILLYFMRRS